MEFTHFDTQGNARMVDVSGKSVTARTAVAEGTIQVSPEVFQAIEQKTVKKGDVLTVAQVAGILGADLYDVLPQFRTELLKFFDSEAFDVGGRVYLV